MQYCFERLVQSAGDGITSEMVADRRLELIKKYSPNYAASCFRTLRAILETSGLQSNPIKLAFKRWGWSLQSSPTESPQYLMPDQIRTLFNGYAKSLSDDYKEVYVKQEGYDDVYLGAKPAPNIFAASLYLLLIGGRKQDAVNLEWQQVDYEKNRITYPATNKKEKRPHVVPITGILVDILKRLPRYDQNPERVFGMTDQMFRKRYEEQIQPIIRYSSKCLRKTFSEHAGLEGYDDKSIGKSLNHSHAVSGNVTTRSYFTGELVKTHLLDAMYFGLQQRFIYYLFGGELEKYQRLLLNRL